MKALAKIVVTVIALVILSGILIETSFAQDDNRYLLPPQIIENPSSTMYCAENRKYSGVQSMAVSPDGRIWAIWYAGIEPAEDHNNYVVVSTSGDQGKDWKEVFAIDPDGPGPARAFDPQAWIDPNGKLWLFWSQRQHIKEGRPTDGVWTMTTDNPNSETPDWSDPMRLSDGVMMNKPFVLSSGEWVLPISFWHWREEGEENAAMVVSANSGKTWEVRGGVYVPTDARNYDEHMIIERKDGSLWMLVRTLYGIGESTSHDRGVTWSPLTEPSHIKNTTSRFFIQRLSSGNLLLVKNGPIDMRFRRSHLMAFISEDDGYSWPRSLLLDERLGVSYPDGQQTKDGTIYIIYDFERMGEQNILMTIFREEDVISCSARKILEVWQRRRLVSKGGPK
jgi:hypothetical protein